MSEFAYSDGSDQDWLYQQIVTKGRRQMLDLIHERPTWAVTAHLTPQREVLLKHLPLHGRVLEVGAGLGALTGYLCQVADNVVALEPPPQRAEIIRARHDTYKNLTVLSGTLEEQENLGLFDYVLLIGVLEYSGQYVGGKDPYGSLLETCAKLLKPSGALVLAIENKLGYKYLSGAPEDHYGRFAEGLENYPHDRGVRTFSKYELRALLARTGFSHCDFHYPVPDYKLPIEVYAEEYFSERFDPTNTTIPSEMPFNPRQYVLDENLLVSTLSEASLLTDTANSFLVMASRTRPTTKTRTVFTREQTAKRLHERTLTRVVEGDGQRVVRRVRRGEGREGELLRVHKEVQAHGMRVPALISKAGGSFDTEFVPGQTVGAALFWAILRGKTDEIRALMQVFRATTEALATPDGMLPAAYDFTFSNFVITPTGLCLVDPETLLDEPHPFALAMLRALLMYSRNLQGLYARCFSADQLVSIGDIKVPTLLCELLGVDPVTHVGSYHAYEARIIDRFVEPRLVRPVRA